MAAPLPFQHEDHVPAFAQGFALGVVVFLEAVDGHDAPRSCLGQLTDPIDILCVRLEQIRQVYDLLDVVLGEPAQAIDATSEVWRQIRIEKELQARSRSSNRTAASTCLVSISN